MSNARNLSKLLGTDTQITTANIADGVFQANKNLIINGAQLINQRGDATAQSGSGYYSTDRFRLLINQMGGYDISQSSTAPDGFSKSKRFYCSTADASPGASDYIIMQHSIEGYNLQHLDWGSASAKKITLSFWVKSSKTGTYNVEFSQDAANPPYKSLQYTISVADTWEYKTLTFSGNTTDPLTDGTVASLNIYWWLGAGSTFTSGTYNADTWHGTNGNRAVGNVNLSDTVGNNWNITGVQLEVGSTATPFENRSYSDELLRCQRYYVEFGKDLVVQGPTVFRAPLFDTSTVNVGSCFASVSLPVDMRTSGTFTAYRALNGSGANINNTNWGPFTIQSNGRSIMLQKFTDSMTGNQTTVYLMFDIDAEL